MVWSYWTGVNNKEGGLDYSMALTAFNLEPRVSVEQYGDRTCCNSVSHLVSVFNHLVSEWMRFIHIR